jgi:hypothetical protein
MQDIIHQDVGIIAKLLVLPLRVERMFMVELSPEPETVLFPKILLVAVEIANH